MQTKRWDSLYPLASDDARAHSVDGKKRTSNRWSEASSKDASASLVSRLARKGTVVAQIKQVFKFISNPEPKSGSCHPARMIATMSMSVALSELPGGKLSYRARGWQGAGAEQAYNPPRPGAEFETGSATKLRFQKSARRFIVASRRHSLTTQRQSIREPVRAVY